MIIENRYIYIYHRSIAKMQCALQKTALAIQRMILQDRKRTEVPSVFDLKRKSTGSHRHILAELE